ncbi:hypothetical protein SCD_n01336 [Sulfuricella denitrificans skB26]|uniref:Uncharacterized protein n=1 Tax=Sulfuricella denitrificans (strain DSM 22764 / NBRC 105220 / skB26) TaxID=1163617 RepID=S6AC04_SULDS|nr:hypothetical protein [Sulfuricella denitrificans]BAN35163.1 hypothetical protein SCD_n01336 [Sulfuricella denitrificans skB26]
MTIRALSLSKFFMRTMTGIIFFPLVFLGQLTVGHEVALFPLYMIPVAQFSWEFGRKGLAISVVLAVCLWILSSSMSGQEYSEEWLRYWNGLIRGIVYFLAGFFILMFKRTLETHRQRMEAMRALLNVCHGCGAVQGSDGRWIPMDELLSSTVSHQCECPKCSQVAKD